MGCVTLITKLTVLYYWDGNWSQENEKNSSFVINWENRVAWEYKEMVKKNSNTQTIELQICHVLSMTNAILICLATNNRFRIWRMAYP